MLVVLPFLSFVLQLEDYAMNPLLLSLLLFPFLPILDEGKVVLPVNQVSVTPAPVTPPVQEVTTVDKITLEEWYVVTHTSPMYVFSSPEGILTVDKEEGNVRLRGKFAGGNGKVEARAFSAPYVYIITAQKPGKTELILLPKNAESEADAVRQTLTVSGSGPQPPPDIIPDVTPTPPSPEGFRVLLLIDETSNLAQANAVNSLKTIEWLDANCTKDGSKPDWRLWDRTTIEAGNELESETEFWRKLWDEVASKVPNGPHALIVSGTDVRIIPIINTDSLLRTFQAAKAGDL